MLTIGSMFAGIGGLDLAVEAALGATTSWQLDLINADVRRRHWPDALQVEADVRTVDPLILPRVDVLIGGFPCQDLSQAGSGKGLEGERSGLYREVLRFIDALQPGYVVMENVPRLLSRYRDVLDHDLLSRGYSVTWVKAKASDAGAPHLRRRVFVCCVAEEEPTSSVIETSPVATETPWPTPTCGDAKASGSRSLDSSTAHAGTSLTDAIRPDRSWATPAASRPNESSSLEAHRARSEALVEAGSRPLSEPLGLQVRSWATPCKRDHKTGQLPSREGGEALSVQAQGKRLNPDWVETLMGFPVGWTVPAKHDAPVCLRELAMMQIESPQWPRGRYPADWDRSIPWPSYSWEPTRTIPDSAGRQYGRPARLKALGNAVCPQQALLALNAWMKP